MIVNFLRSSYLLNESVLHDDDAVAQGHGLGLVMRDIYERRVDALSQLDELSSHLVPQFGVQVGERLVHQEDLRVSDDCASDRDSLALAAGESLRLSLQVLGDVQYLRSFSDLPVYLLLRSSLDLEGIRHVVIDGHMRIERV